MKELTTTELNYYKQFNQHYFTSADAHYYALKIKKALPNYDVRIYISDQFPIPRWVIEIHGSPYLAIEDLFFHMLGRASV